MIITNALKDLYTCEYDCTTGYLTVYLCFRSYSVNMFFMICFQLIHGDRYKFVPETLYTTLVKDRAIAQDLRSNTVQLRSIKSVQPERLRLKMKHTLQLRKCRFEAKKQVNPSTSPY